MNYDTKRMQELAGIKKEENKQTYDYGCVMLYFNVPIMSEIHKAIHPSDVYTEEGDRSFGLEKQPHCTLLYGLHEEVTDKQVTDVLEKFTFDACTIHNASVFENAYDVLKFDVTGTNLHKCNAELTKLPHTTDYPDYHPHMTIGYLKSGKAKNYTHALSDRKFKIKPTHAVYSKPDGSKITIKINKK